MTQDEPLVELLFDRLATDGVPDETADVVLAAMSGDDDVQAALAGRPTRLDLAGRPTIAKRDHIYLAAVTVAGFRGVGPERTLAVRPGPGLTLVVGRNGSGKSSFAEAIELALTGDSARWADRNSVWRQGWRNLHTPDPCAIMLELRVDGAPAPTRIRRSWTPGGDLTPATVEVTTADGAWYSLDALDLGRPLELYRPFLTAGDLGRLVTSTPSALHDSINSILGLELLGDADRRMMGAIRPVDAALKDLRERRLALRTALAGIVDERAARAAHLLAAASPDLDRLDAILAEPIGDDADETVGFHRRLAALTLPELATVLRLAEELAKAAVDAQRFEAGHSRASVLTAELLRLAIDHHTETGDELCPVCRTGVLDTTWRQRATGALDELRETMVAAKRAASVLTELTRRARAVVDSVQLPTGHSTNIALETVRAEIAVLHSAPRSAPDLAAHLSGRYPQVAQAIADVRSRAEDLLRQRDSAWQAVVAELRAWSAAARRAPALQADQRRLKNAREWLKATGEDIRNARLAPFAAHSQHIWSQLRQESNVELGGLALQGNSTRRKVEFRVSVDGTEEGTSLGVMSQGELQALGLATFLPRSCATESPFRFVVIDDPVQSMDPSKVDGLARVLAELAEERQVVVFTHDRRLPDAVRRLEIDAQVLEVVRAERSVVTVRPGLDPVTRYLDDARAVALSGNIPKEVCAPVVAELCRSALEAACHRVVWRRRAGRGERHLAIEEVLDRAGKSITKALALAVFDDIERGGDVLDHLNRTHGRPAGAAYVACRKGVHGNWHGDLPDLVRQVRRITEAIA